MEGPEPMWKRLQRGFVALLVAGALSVVTASMAQAKVLRVIVEHRSDVLGGRSFGVAGPYEKLVGRVLFVFDPANPHNARIVDLENAPRNADGMVEAWANFVVLRPKHQPAGGRTALLEVSNRGGKLALTLMNAGSMSLDPTTAEDYGDGLAFRLGLTVMWVGWQHDMGERDDALRIHIPTATANGRTITGLVRSDWTVDRTASTLGLGHGGHRAYPVANFAHRDNVLTVRDGRMAERRVVPRDSWRFAVEASGRTVEDSTSITLDGGFQAGKIYELVYRARDPQVVGLGLAALRDFMAYAKYDPASPFPVDHGLAMGISQTGRLLRQFVYQGFNTDEAGRQAYDGLLVLVAGAGRGSFNHRFAQPSRDAHRYSAFFYPTDIFPFTSRDQTDPETGRTDGLYADARSRVHLPKMFYINSGYEYWGRAASLIHTSLDGRRDVDAYDNERIYHIASAQHWMWPFPPPPEAKMEGTPIYRGNPVDYGPHARALLVRMMDWVRDGETPPPSEYPRVGERTLVPIQRVDFPAIPGVAFPKVIHEAYRADYGPRWTDGVVDRQPPKLGKPFATLVSQVDSLGNEVAGLRPMEVLAPLATYTPWNLRIGFPGGTDELTRILGSYIPFSRTASERRASGDPRPSIEELYGDKTRYLRVASEAARSLVQAGFLLEEDIDRVTARASAHWDWLHAN